MENSAYTASFARIYDEIMKSVPYKFWYDYINEIMDYYQLKAEKVLDLACGTGNMSLLYAKNSYQVTGIDRSEEMLKIAGKKARRQGQISALSMLIFVNSGRKRSTILLFLYLTA